MDADLLDRDEEILRDHVDVGGLAKDEPAGAGGGGAVIGERGGGDKPGGQQQDANCAFRLIVPSLDC